MQIGCKHRGLNKKFIPPAGAERKRRVVSSKCSKVRAVKDSMLLITRNTRTVGTNTLLIGSIWASPPPSSNRESVGPTTELQEYTLLIVGQGGEIASKAKGGIQRPVSSIAATRGALRGPRAASNQGLTQRGEDSVTT